MERDYKVDFLRAIAIIFVLIIHSTNRYGVTHTELLIANWFALFTRPTIAIFLFIAGYLIKIDAFGTRQLSRRLVRVLVPYAIFSLLALLYDTIGFYQVSLEAWMLELGDFALDFMVANTMSIYYFVFVIISMYLMAFLILRVGFLRARLRSITIILVVLNVLHALFFEPIVQYFQLSDSQLLFIYFYRSPLIWSAFFFLGILFRQYDGQKIVDQYRTHIWALFSGVFILYNILYFTLFQHSFIGRTADLGYNSIIGTVYSLITVFFLLTFNFQHKAIDFLSRISYFLYLSHIFFVYILQTLIFRLDLYRGFWAILVSLAISFVGPIVLYFIMKRMLGKRTQFLLGG